jgi:hypothetical protein
MKNELRFLTQEQYNELINLYHLARAAGARTKYEQMIKSTKWFSEKHPEISATAAYKDLSANIQ